MAIDLEQRYDTLGSTTDHVCTGNTVYRAEAVHQVGLFDESLGYGYDNDISYRLRSAGHELMFVREATSVHHWRSSFATYLSQQYGFGYGRLDVVRKHPTRVGGDDVSGAVMMLHPVGVGISLALLVAGQILSAASPVYNFLNIAAAAFAVGLLIERAIAGVLAWRRFGDRAALLFPVWHLARDLAWVGAVGTWTVRRLFARRRDPAHSMVARPVTPEPTRHAAMPIAATPAVPSKILGLIPAHNERATLATVLGEIQAHHPTFDLLVVDDGSTDGSSWLLDELGASYIRLPERMGVGTAMRAGLGYAARFGYDAVVRLDGDGQHHPEDIDRVVGPLMRGEADVVLGSRYVSTRHETPLGVRAVQRVLALCLSAATQTRVTDPTSGFCAIGPRAVRLLADHHPTGYPEPELRLLLSRNGLIASEVPVQSRPRREGRSTLTYFRLAAAAARVLLALATVPFRRAVVAPPDRD
jgi:cellulose synthase/poly-beta-1,6-N-acetylglucosamine synthase-like glycosyltransferase